MSIDPSKPQEEPSANTKVEIFRKTIYLSIFVAIAGIIGIIAGFVGVFLHYSPQGTLSDVMSSWAPLIYSCPFSAALVMLTVYFRRSVLVRFLVVLGLIVTLVFFHEVSCLKERRVIEGCMNMNLSAHAKQSDIITLVGDIESLYQEKDADMLYSLLGALAILALIPIDRRNKQRQDANSPKPPI